MTPKTSPRDASPGIRGLVALWEVFRVDLEPTGGPLNRIFGRGTPLRSTVADAALSAKDRLPEPIMRLAMKALRPPRK